VTSHSATDQLFLCHVCFAPALPVFGSLCSAFHSLSAVDCWISCYAERVLCSLCSMCVFLSCCRKYCSFTFQFTYRVVMLSESFSEKHFLLIYMKRFVTTTEITGSCIENVPRLTFVSNSIAKNMLQYKY